MVGKLAYAKNAAMYHVLLFSMLNTQFVFHFKQKTTLIYSVFHVVIRL